MSTPTLRIRDLGYTPGLLPPGPTNSILDVPGVHISQLTVPTSANLKPGSTATKGLTLISPRPPLEFYKPCHAATFCFNGNGELTGGRQVEDWGYVNTPIAFTNSLSLGTVFDGVWDWVLEQQGQLGWDSLTRARNYGTPVVGETADWGINCDVRQSRLEVEDVRRCFEGLKCREDGAVVEEGQRGGGAGMMCHQFTGGTGTSSRVLPAVEGEEEGYTLAALCQSNYGHLPELTIGGVPIGRLLQKEKAAQGSSSKETDITARANPGSILILLLTNAPLLPHQLQRLARHATVGLAAVGSHGIGQTFSGDIFLAVSTAEHGPEQIQLQNANRNGLGPPLHRPTQTYTTEVVKNECIDTYFYGVAEAVEEAVLNSLVGGREGTVGMDRTVVEGLPVERVKELLGRYLVKV